MRQMKITEVMSKLLTEFEFIIKSYNSQNKGMISAVYKLLLSANESKILPYQKSWQKDCSKQLEETVRLELWSTTQSKLKSFAVEIHKLKIMTR
ncbi:UNVERIFIED_CONTAM: hypothetical protein K2H54_056894, partial [Gekko kuhli]